MHLVGMGGKAMGKGNMFGAGAPPLIGGKGKDVRGGGGNVPWNYKTKPCATFMAGNVCQFGERCAFYHSEAERREPNYELRALQHAAKGGSSKGGKGKGKGSGKGKGPGGLCHAFREHGWCRFGSNCRYQHDR